MRKPRRSRPPAQQPRPTDQPLPPEARDQDLIERTAIWQGPLPPPAVLEQFSRLVPDAPERIIRQWEIEADHRRAYEAKALDGALARDRIGMRNALIFALSALLVAALALWLGYPTTAGIVGGTTVVGVVGAFLWQRGSRPKKNDVDR